MSGINLIRKAKDDIDLAEKLMGDERQHDNVGYHLAQAVEKIFKFLCQEREIRYLKSSKGHSLTLLWQQLSEHNDLFLKYRILLKLDVYQAEVRYDYLAIEDRADLSLMIQKIYRLLEETVSPV